MAYGKTERPRLRVIMDTNAFFVPLQFKISLPTDLENLLNRNCEIVLLSVVKGELMTLASRKSPSVRKKAEFALKLAEKCTYIKTETTQTLPTDDAIAKIAKEWTAAVFTNDRQLRRRLRDISVPVIYVRQKSRLAVNGLI